MNNANDKLGIPKFDGVVDAWDTNDGQYFKGKAEQHNPYPRNSEITKVDGVNAYSQIQSLYKGMAKHQSFVPQPGLNTETGKMPPGKLNPEPPRPYVERNKMGFKPYGPIGMAGSHPVISPEASNISDSTTASTAIHTTIRDLKRELNRGAGSRTNKYVLEFDMPIKDAPGVATLNVLCQATSFPQRNMTVATLWRFGRKYNLRGETDYGGSWTLTFVDDSEMTLRKAMDKWHIDIDDSKLQGTGLERIYLKKEEKIKHSEIDLKPREQGFKYDYFSNARVRLGKEYEPSRPLYQTDIRVYQLDQVGNKTMGYLMQNAFISEISQIDYGDDQADQLTKFSITITFSEFLPLADETLF